MTRTTILLFVGCLLFASPVSADHSVACGSYFTPAVLNHLMICPQGDGDRFDEVGGPIVSANLEISGDPVVGMPATDYWLIGEHDDAIALCGSYRTIDADAATDANGMTTISGTWAAGGCDTGLRVIAQGMIFMTDPPCEGFRVLNVPVSSPDMNADRVVDTGDLSIFAAAYRDAPGPCSDFNGDGQTDLGDFAIFASHFGHSNPFAN